MAAPEEMTSLDISGRFWMNKDLSDDMDSVFVRQKLSWLTRTAIPYATITIDIHHFKEDDGIERINIDQTLTGGIQGTSEKRTMDWQERPHSDHIFGNVVGKSRRVPVTDLDDDFFKNGWAEEYIKDGLIESYVVSIENDWTVHQIWGFEMADDGAGNKLKRYVRRLKFIGQGVRIDRKLVYDYAGPVPKPKSG